jgi:hypothetical protein
MESELDQENPTAGDSGASIEDRLVNFLSAEEKPEQKPEAPEAKAPEAQEQAEVKDQPEGDAPDDKQPQLTTAQLAEMLGVDESALDVDQDGKVHVKTKIDGKDGAAKFADLVKNYQLGVHADNRTRAVAEQERALQAREQEVETAFKQRLDHAEQLTRIAAEELMQEYKSYDWKALDQHPDQGAVAALKLKFQERQQKIQAAFHGINTHKGQLGQQAKAQREAFLAKEAERLPQVIPEWKDRAIAEREGKEIVEWCKKVGYDESTIRALNESSALHIATVRKAMLQDKLQESKAVVEQKVRLAPKIVKPGQAVQDTKAESLRNLKQEVRKSGGKGTSLEDYLIATGKV